MRMQQQYVVVLSVFVVWRRTIPGSLLLGFTAGRRCRAYTQYALNGAPVLMLVHSSRHAVLLRIYDRRVAIPMELLYRQKLQHGRQHYVTDGITYY